MDVAGVSSSRELRKIITREHKSLVTSASSGPPPPTATPPPHIVSTVLNITTDIVIVMEIIKDNPSFKVISSIQ